MAQRQDPQQPQEPEYRFLIEDADTNVLKPTEEDLKAVAQGREPRPFSGAFRHPLHGVITFKMKLPRTADMAEHTVAMDNLLSELYGAARGGTMLLVAAIAGLNVLVDLPVIDEKLIESEESDAEARVERIRYDPLNELNEHFPVEVWMLASAWRQAFIEPDALDRLGNSSGETHGSGSSTSSAAPTGSPLTTNA